MVALYLLTNKFNNVVEESNLFTKYSNEMYIVNLEDYDYKKFKKLLINIIFANNAITSESEKLRYIIEKKIFHDFDDEMIPIINYFIEDKFINIDGFLEFALDEYSYRVNEVLYILAKMSFEFD